MHSEILTPEQVELLPVIKKFSLSFSLVGGTAIALYIGHRRSVDFDLFTDKKFKNINLKKKLLTFKKIDNVLVNEEGEFTVFAKGVKITFFQYPYKIEYDERLNDVIKMPNLLTLAAMKAFALGRRAKWKDYVDLYFIMEKYHGLDKIIKKAKQIFKSEFNEKIFRTQLAYFKDIDYSEEVIFMKGFEVSSKVIQKELTNFSLS